MTAAIAFGTDGWRATLDTFTTDRVRQVGQAVATYLNDHGLTGAPVAIGYDARQSSPGFARDLADVLRSNGIDVLVSGRDIPTPVLAWTIADRRLAGGLMVTASHNPPSYNGVKFITRSGAPALPSVTASVEERLAPPRVVAASENSREERLAAIPSYVDHVRAVVDADLRNVSVVYDAIHGSARGVTDRVLTQCGARVNALRCTRDPAFGGGGPNPTPERLQTLIQTVRRTDADLGIANDGDADRIAVITPRRGYLNENLFFAALYEYLLERERGPAVRTVSTTHLIDRIADAHGQDVIETPVGFKWIAAAMREVDALVGGEESGGFSIRGHVREKDGVLMGVLACAMHQAEPIDDRVDRILDEYGTIVQDRRSVDCADEKKDALMQALEEALPSDIAGSPVDEIGTVDGFKITLEDDSWLLIRPSGTEPKVRIYAEAADQARVDAVLDAAESILSSIP